MWPQDPGRSPDPWEASLVFLENSLHCHQPAQAFRVCSHWYPRWSYQPPPAGSPGQGRNHLGPLGQPLAAETLQLWESCGRTSSGGEAGGELYTTGCLHLSRVFLLVPTTTQARAQPSTRELSSKSQHCSGYEACGHQSLRQPHTLLGMGFGV